MTSVEPIQREIQMHLMPKNNSALASGAVLAVVIGYVGWIALTNPGVLVVTGLILLTK